ncbi:ribosomal large subunit pseudouridylate synthase D [Spiroplasma corruscae]|uniref:Pseudouridine synthase n=1 Tax=Spiroplasma corruscae TaxID=216934 RepID=A0A222EP02_9MOLU|nr:RluA family pseudouridine synthase [Spiroplasma corruscae]ASP28024.1 ribosomal large subunit pseudouridylate synthase D [Spiroplasma corruscae]
MEQKIKYSFLSEPIRIDKYLVQQLTDDYNFSRTYIQKIIEQKKVKVNEEVVNSKYILQPNDTIEVLIPEPEKLDTLPEDIDFDIIYEDNDILVINKPNGLVVHPAPGNLSGTLVNGLLFRIKNLSSINGVLRPGIVHRIDKNTNGLLIVAKTDNAHKVLVKMLGENKIYKEYIALVHGVVESNKGLIDAPIGRHRTDRKKMAVTEVNSKRAITKFEVLKRFTKHSLLKCVIDTGRTHQIRVHLSYINHPVLGDSLYSYKEDSKIEYGQYLHAHKLVFNHPITNKKLEFVSEIPDEFNVRINMIEN